MNRINDREMGRMRKLILFYMAVTLLMTAGAAPVYGGCNPYGVSTLRGDAVYPPGWFNQNVIGILPPDEYVFGAIDGSVLPQQFTRIRAKVRNQLAGVPLQDGNLIAVAWYRLRTDYAPDLSADPIDLLPTIPPQPDNVEAHLTTSKSAPIAFDLLPSDQYIPVAFDFSDDPIPASVVDLVLQVYYYGFAGEEKDKAVIVTSAIDLNEPMHLTYWNNMDHFVLYDNLYPIDAISSVNSPAECWTEGYYLDLNAHFYIGFSAADAEPATPVAYIEHLVPGHHSRLIVLAKAGPLMTRTWLKADGVTDWYEWKYDHMSSYIYNYERLEAYTEYRDTIHGGVVNQQDEDGFTVTNPITIRTLKTHFADYYFMSCPTDYTRSELNGFYRDLAPLDDVPDALKILDMP